MLSFDWHSPENHILLNPRLSQKERQETLAMLTQCHGLQGHFWISTSGSTSLSPGRVKWAALSKAAILASASAVNEVLSCDTSDKWLNLLPPFHVGGLGIFARAYLSHSLVIDGHAHLQPKWNPEKAYDMLCAHCITLTSLVPAQLFDFVKLKKKSPSSLRGVIVGGGALSEIIYQQALELGWKILPSYGLTECASQVATATSGNHNTTGLPGLTLLPHIQAKMTSSGFIALKSPALLSMYAINTDSGVHFMDPKKEGWFETEDLGQIEGKILTIKGRHTHFVKIGGESVDLLRLEIILERIKYAKNCAEEMVLVPLPDERLGNIIHLAALTSGNGGLIQEIVEQYQKQVLPFEKIRQIHFVDAIPRTELSKVIMAQLVDKLTR